MAPTDKPLFEIHVLNPSLPAPDLPHPDAPEFAVRGMTRTTWLHATHW